MLFWVIAGALAVLTAVLVAWPLLKSGGVAADDPNLEVYKDQLAEIESDLSRGVLSPTEAEGLRVEVSRRLLRAAQDAQAAGGHGPVLIGAVAVAAVVLMGGAATYMGIGAPGLQDQPLEDRLRQNAERYAERPTQAELRGELENAQRAPMPQPVPEEQADLLRQLQEILVSRPDDLRGHRLLVDNLARIEDWVGAAEGQASVLRILGDRAGPEEFIDHAEFLILAVNGYVSPEAEASLRRGLEMSPNNPRGRYYAGLSATQAGRADLAYETWMRLLSESSPDAPWVAAIHAQIREVALAAGRPIPPGPTAEDIEAASEMSDADRQEMIRGMVSGLAERLADEGGTSDEWARLIRAYGVLGERALANQAWADARAAFEGSMADLAILRQAAQDAEIAQ